MNQGGEPSSNSDNLAANSGKVFSSTMPTGQIDERSMGANSGTIYGNSNYINPNLQGYSSANQNIINVDQLQNGITPMDMANINQIQRGNTMPNNPPTDYSGANNPNQMYMRPPTLPPINQTAANQQTNIYTGVNDTTPSQQQPDLSTAAGSLAYLNTISSPVAQTNTSSLRLPTNPLTSKLFLAIGIGLIVLVVLVAIVGALSSGSRSGLSSRAQELGKAIANLQSIVDYGESNSRYVTSDLDGITAETHLVTLSHQVQLSGLMPLAIDEDGEVTEAEADATTTDELDAALAQGRLSTVYQQALVERLTTVSEATAAAYEATDNEEIKTALNKTYLDMNELIHRVDTAISSSGGESAD